MAAAKKGLGRGFESLIPTDLSDAFNDDGVYDPTATEDKKVSTEQTLPLTKLRANAEQPRRAFDEEALQELAASIKEHGLIQPIVVTPRNGDSSTGADTGTVYEIVAGERRYRASKLAGLTEVPVIIRTLSAQNQLEISLIENIQRRDLNSIETATAYAKLRDQFNLTNEQIAQRVHKSPSAVNNTMRLLKLPKAVVALVADGTLKEGQVRPLIGLSEPDITAVLPRLVKDEWSARKVEQYVVTLKERLAAGQNGTDTTTGADTATDSLLRDSEPYGAVTTHLRERLGSNVSIRTNSKGAGKIVIPFKDKDDFERIQQQLK